MKEKWKFIPGYKGLYKVSNFGRVKSLPRLITRVQSYGMQQFVQPGRLLKLGWSKGYPKVTLTKHGVETQYWVHRLVALTFIGNPPFPDALVLHSDDNPANPRWDNLRWGTHQDNSDDQTRQGKQIKGIDVNTALLTPKKVRKIVNWVQSGAYTNKAIAEHYGVSRSTITDIMKGRSWTHVTGIVKAK